jgi:hypothetical protein
MPAAGAGWAAQPEAAWEFEPGMAIEARPEGGWATDPGNGGAERSWTEQNPGSAGAGAADGHAGPAFSSEQAGGAKDDGTPSAGRSEPAAGGQASAPWFGGDPERH